MRLAIIAALATFLFVPAIVSAETAVREISVTGEGRVAAIPDTAVLSIGVTKEARFARDAMTDASREVADVLKTLGAQGIEARDIQTSALSLSPRWDRQNNARPRIVGYVASNTLSVRIRALDGLGGVLDKVIGSGANQMNDLSFTVSDPSPLESDARALAVKDAMQKAATLAEAAGVQLGPVLRISEGGVSMPQPQFRTEAFAADVPIAAGEIDTRVSVVVVFGIAD